MLAGQASCVAFPRGAQLSPATQAPVVRWPHTASFCLEETQCAPWRASGVASAGEPVNMTTETANRAGILRNRRMSLLHSLSLDDVAQRRRPHISDPIYCLRRFNRRIRLIGTPLRMAVLDWSGAGTRACTAVPILSRKAGSEHEIAPCRCCFASKPDRWI